MARAISADVIECRAPTVAQAQRLYENTIGEATSVIANRIVIEATGSTVRKRTKSKGRGAKAAT